MINVILWTVRCNDDGKIKALEIKVQASPEQNVNKNIQNLLARVSASFHSFKLFSEQGKSTKMQPRPRNIVDINVRFIDDNTLSEDDINTFIKDFKKALNHAPF